MKDLKQLYYDGELSVGANITPHKDLAKRLSRVLRFETGDTIALFNGKTGLFEVEILNDRCTELYVKSILKPQPQHVRSYLLVALVKKDAMDRIFRQATEFGVTDIIPLITEHTIVDKLNEERIQSLLIEASEQCERLSIPVLHPVTKMTSIIPSFGGRIFWCAEHIAGRWNFDSSSQPGDALLVGPEGGFSKNEKIWLKECINIVPVGLGPYILRADTAVCAGLSRFFDHMN